MQSRILYITPSGPLCFIDYLTVADGMAVLEQLKQTVRISSLTRMFYEFRLLKMVKDKLIGIDRLFLPCFDRQSVSLFLDSCEMPSEQYPSR